MNIDDMISNAREVAKQHNEKHGSNGATMCSPLREHKNGNKPIQLCSTCALNIDNIQTGTRVAKWINITPAFWNGTRYVCEHHMEIQHAGA